MDTLKEYQETIDLFGKKREVRITIKFEPDPDAISVIEGCDWDCSVPEAISDYEKGNFSVDFIWVEVKCDLFSGIDSLGGCVIEFDSKYDHLSEVNDHNMVNEAIDDYKKDAQKYKDFFEEN